MEMPLMPEEVLFGAAAAESNLYLTGFFFIFFTADTPPSHDTYRSAGRCRTPYA